MARRHNTDGSSAFQQILTLPVVCAPFVFFGVDRIPQGGPLMTVGMRIGPRFLPPSIGIDWRLEAEEQGSTALRSMSWTSWLPPYLAPELTIQ